MINVNPVSSIMTISPVVANQASKFSQVLRLFTEFPVHHLPIVDDDNKLIGILSTNDIPKVITRLCNTGNLAMSYDAIDQNITIKEIMTANPYTIGPAQTIGTAAKLMVEKKVLALPVVENGQIIGILSMKDIVAYAQDIFDGD